MNRFLKVTALLLFIISCKKQDSEQAFVSDPNNPQVRVSGFSDVVVERSPFRPERVLATRAFSVLHRYGSSPLLMLGTEGLPVGLTASFSVDHARPSFSDTISFMDNGVPAGTYNPSLLLMPQQGDTLRYPFKIEIIGDTVCNNYFLNRKWKAYSKCYETISALYTAQVTQIGNTDSLP